MNYEVFLNQAKQMEALFKYKYTSRRAKTEISTRKRQIRNAVAFYLLNC